MSLQEQATSLRVKLEVIQQIPWHSQIGTVIMIKGEPLIVDDVVQKWGSRQICPKCPKKRECRKLSLDLADIETKIIGADQP